MKISKDSIAVTIILFFLMSRVMIDVVWARSKPVVIVGYYTVFALILSFYCLKKGRGNEKLFPLFIFLYPVTLLASQVSSDVPLLEHIKFALQVYVPCLFLVAISNMPRQLYQVGLVYKQYFAFAAVLILMAASYISYVKEALPGVTYYQHYINAPNHVIAQSLLKASLPLIASGFIWVAIPFALIFTLNVRSVLLAYILSVMTTHRKIFLQKKVLRRGLVLGVPLLILVVTNVDWMEVYNRVVFKGRDIADADSVGNAVASGRFNIYQFYLSYIDENFGFKEWLVGTGPVWLADDGPRISAHNDVLNLFVSFGLFGLVGTLACYWYFYKKLPTMGRSIFFASFSVLFLTNGVVFHQSNVLFALLFIFTMNKEKAVGNRVPFG